MIFIFIQIKNYVINVHLRWINYFTEFHVQLGVYLILRIRMVNHYIKPLTKTYNSNTC